MIPCKSKDYKVISRFFRYRDFYDLFEKLQTTFEWQSLAAFLGHDLILISRKILCPNHCKKFHPWSLVVVLLLTTGSRQVG